MFYQHHFIAHSSSDTSSFWGALAGAFFAFVFGLIAYVITKRRESFVEHKNTLVRLQRVLNKHLQDIGSLDTLARGMDTSLSFGNTTSNRLPKMEIPEGLDMQIRSVDLVNKLMTYQISVDRLNLNVSMVNHALTRIEDLFINGRTVAVQNLNIVRNNLSQLREDLSRLNERTKRFLVLVRLHYKKIKDKNSFVYGVYFTQWEQDISEEEIRKEHQKLEEEITQIMAQIPENLL